MSGRHIARLLAALAFLLGVLAITAPTSPAAAETGKKALVLGTSVSGGASSLEATRATALGFTVTVVTDATWLAMTSTDFADYQLVIVGDPTCSSLEPAVSQNAQALADAVMARAGGNTKAGNRVLIGTDPVFHQGQGGSKMIDTAIDFAGVQEGATNLYLSFTCVDPDWNGNGTPDGQELLLPLLTTDATPNWTQNSGPPCGGSVSLISNADQFATLTTPDIQGWSCSDHESFPTFPSDWIPLAVATDTPTAPTCGTDVTSSAAVCGEAYVLVSGSGVVATAPDLSLTPATETLAVGASASVTALVHDGPTPRAGVEVTFTVTGANAGATGTCAPVSCVSDADGHVVFTYTGAAGGDDTINASVTISGSTQTATAAKTFGDEPPPSENCSNGIDDDGDGFIDLDDPDCAPPPEQLCNGLEATIVGSNSADVLTGTEGDDVIVGRQGNDTINGAGGNDTICGGTGDDAISGGNGNDTMQGNKGNDLIHGNKGNDKLSGQQGDDNLQGDQGTDILAGNEGNDRLSGGEDTDACDGGTGTNVLNTCP